MIIKDILYYLKYYKNWIISIFIFTILFFISIFLSYFGSLHLLHVDKPLLDFFAESISYTLFIYMIATLLGIVLVSLVRLIGFFRKKDLEVLLEIKTQFLKDEINQALNKLQLNDKILSDAPVGIFMTVGHNIVYANSWMKRFWNHENISHPIDRSKLFISQKEFLALEKKVLVALTTQKHFSTQIALENKKGQKSFVHVSVYSYKPKDPKKGIIWFMTDASLEVKNVELETYYQTVFRVMSILHIAEESNIPENEVLKQIALEVIGVYGIKTAFYWRYVDKKLHFVFAAGEEKSFPNRPDIIDVVDKSNAGDAAVKAVLTKRSCVCNDLMDSEYYKKYFMRKANKKQVKANLCIPLIINDKVEGVISLWSYETGMFYDSFKFRLQQLSFEICRNLADIRVRRKAKEAIRHYEECLRAQIHELENNKKIMQQQASEVNAMIGDLIIARDAAEKANRIKTEFLANVSHELRTPLNAILGFSEAIEKETFGPLENTQYKNYIGYISTSGKHLLSLINDVLDLSRVEVGKQKMTEEEIKVIPVIKDVLSVIERYPGGDKRYITLTPQKSNLTLLADERSFKQIMLNVLSNAVKFTPEDGQIKINVNSTKKKELLIEVSDNGIGIPKDKVNDLFQPFSQVENIMTREHEGSGLGLVLIRKLMELHGGRVWIESEEGKGCSVFMLFPKNRVLNSVRKKRIKNEKNI
ncbi:MAG: hypothetical protein IKV03_06635 [Alphaproteobacteria bacterium]|nr:hypothetical protein [Alphaproteobacteria bacterium]